MHLQHNYIRVLALGISLHASSAVAGDIQTQRVKEPVVSNTVIAINATLALVSTTPLLHRAYLERRSHCLTQRLQEINAFDAAHYAHLEGAHKKCLDAVTQRKLPDDIIAFMATSHLATMKTHNDQRKKLKEERDKVTAQLRMVAKTLDEANGAFHIGAAGFSFLTGMGLCFRYFPNTQPFKYMLQSDPAFFHRD